MNRSYFSLLVCFLFISDVTKVLSAVTVKKGGQLSRDYKSPAEEFWGDKSREDIKQDFDRFVVSEGGIANPAENLLLLAIDNFKPQTEVLERAKLIFDRNKIILHRNFDENIRKGKVHQKFHDHVFASYGCEDYMGFHFEGDVWYSRGCRRHKCLHFRGDYFVETDSCDTEIYNTTYKCIIEADLNKNYPMCCPKYICNPDNLGNRINVR